MRQRSETEKYLAPTPEAFLRLARLLKYDRLYLAPVYDKYLDLLLHPSRRAMALMPRGSFKSTWLCVSVTRDIILNPNIRILYGSETLPNSKKYLGMVRRSFETNDELRDLFGDFVAERAWREDEFTVRGRTDWSKKEPTLSCAGLGVTKTGMHYDKIYVDDPVGDSNRGTREAIEKVTDWFQMLLSIAEDVVDPDTGQTLSSTAIIVNGTPYDDGDVFGYIQEINKKLVEKQRAGEKVEPYRIVIQPAEDATGGCPFPHLTRDVLEQQKIEKGSRYYASQMLLDPVPAEFALFKRGQFRMIPAHDLPPKEDLYFYLLTDTATTKDAEDDTVAAVIAKDFLGTVYVVDMVVQQMGPVDVVKTIFSLYVKWQCRKVLMEKIAINEIYGVMLESMARETQTRIMIEPVTGRTTESKAMRIQSLQGRLESGKILFSGALPQELIRVEQGKCFGKIVEEFVRFSPRSRKKDDIPDCLSDMDKQDPRGAPLCPAPHLVRKKPVQPAMVNGKYAALPKPGQPQANFWGNLATQTGRKG